MSSGSSSDGNYSCAPDFCVIEELMQVRTRFEENRKEKDMLNGSQSQSFELIRRLDVHMKTLSEAHLDDNKRIYELETELKKCSQEIDFVQDQLNSRNTEIFFLQEEVHKLTLQLAEIGDLQEMVSNLQAELRSLDSERLCLMQELDSKVIQLQKSTSCIRKLEESMSYVGLESQCEIESMRIDLVSLEQSYFEAKKSKDVMAIENSHMNSTIQNLELQLHDAKKIIECLGKENKELREKVQTSESDARKFCQIFEEHLAESLEDMLPLIEMETKPTTSEEMSFFGEVCDPLPKLVMAAASHEDLLQKIHEYELRVQQLTDDLKKQKLKAEDEAEDLAQEMAELRYQMTSLLDEERNRRVHIENVSLHRIIELEAQIQHESRTYSAVEHLYET